MKTVMVAVVCVCALVCTSATARKAQGAEPRFGPMVALPCEGNAEAFALNDRGDVVGYCWDWPTMWTATKDGHGQPTYFGIDMVTYADGQPVAGEIWWGSAYGINERGQVAVAIVVDGYYQPSIYQDGVHRMLPLAPGAVGGVLRGINDRGDAVGSSGGLPAFWRDGRFIELPTPWGNGGLAYSVNNVGEVAGVVYDLDGMWWPVLWRQHGRAHGANGLAWDVIVLDPAPGFARCVSDSGHLAGTTGDNFDGYTGYPMAWKGDGEWFILHALGDVAHGSANSVNSRGERVGYAGVNGGDEVPMAVFWQSVSADPIALGTLATDGTDFSFARAINNRGDVAGTSGNSYTGDIGQAFFVERLSRAEP